jgi:hypothetical protein
MCKIIRFYRLYRRFGHSHARAMRRAWAAVRLLGA